MSIFLWILGIVVALTAAWPTWTLIKKCAKAFWGCSSELKYYVIGQSLAVVVIMLTVPKHWSGH